MTLSLPSFTRFLVRTVSHNIVCVGSPITFTATIGTITGDYP